MVGFLRNIVVASIVKKVGLKIEQYPQPYIVG